MRKIKNTNIDSLLMQLKFTPQNKRKEQLKGAEELYNILDEEKGYPFDFICYKITGLHLKSPVDQPPIRGSDLAEDLKLFILKLSGQVAQHVNELDENVYTIQTLAKDYNVSEKTISRWRNRNLLAKKYIFENGTKRIGFSQTAVDKFLESNADLVEKSKDFKRLSNKEKKHIITLAKSLTTKSNLSRHQVIKKIRTETGKAHETIRYILLNHTENNSAKKIISPRSPIKPHQARELFQYYKQGHRIRELMKMFNRSRSSIHRIIKIQRAKEILAEKIEFIPSDEFLKDNAETKILKKPLSISKIFNTATPVVSLDTKTLQIYLNKIQNASNINREQEIELFRRYNYLKYLAAILRAGMYPSKVKSPRLKKIETYLKEADLIKNYLIESYLKLVVNIAKRHISSGGNLLDLISEGNIALMRAVEKFDYTKQVRFNTYASWVIAKDFAHVMPGKSREKTASENLHHVHKDLRITDAIDFNALEKAHKNLVKVIKDNLNDKEQYVILHHFGLASTSIKKQIKTLKQIGEDLNLTKERIRQIELQALQKLRQSLSPEQFELLTG